MLGGLVLAAMPAAVLILLQERAHMFVLSAEVLFVVSALSGFLAWALLWRKALLRIGRTPFEGDKQERLSMVICFGLWFTAVIFQLGLRESLAEIVSVNSPTDLVSMPPARFLVMPREHVHVDRRACTRIWDTSRTSSKDSAVTVDLNIACPLLPRDANIWLVLRYSKDASRAELSDAGRRAPLFNEIAAEARAAAKGWSWSSAEYFERLETAGRARAISRRLPARATVLLAHRQPYERRGQDLIVASCILWMLALLGLAIVPIRPAWADASEDEPRSSLAASEWLDLLVPGRVSVATPLLLDINLLVYLAMAFSGAGVLEISNPDLLSWGANHPALLAEGQWWRLFTYQFLHGGLPHLLTNCITLLVAGLAIESSLAWPRTLATYLLSGVVGGIASAKWGANLSVGASGAVLGLIGALCVVSWSPIGAGRQAAVLALVLCGLNLLTGFLPGVDGAAHVGGIGAGGLMGGVFVLEAWLRARRRRNGR
jgi:rhomboid protease GluP